VSDDGPEYDTQLYIGPERPQYADLDPVENDNMHKPRGGLWTSTWLGEPQLSHWVRWSAGEQFYTREEEGWVIEATPGSHLVVIDSVADLEAVVGAYTDAQEVPSGDPRMDFEALSHDYHGVWLTEDGQRDTHLRGGQADSLYGWDAESTLWFDWRIESIEPIGNIEWEDHPSYRELW
jgi:uncharacterized protein RhaS with RHS repeats